jgi:hypothetical protein
VADDIDFTHLRKTGEAVVTQVSPFEQALDRDRLDIEVRESIPHPARS